MESIEIVKISTDVIQLDQLLKWMGLTETGGKARFLIDDGQVMVNDFVITERRKKIHSGDMLVIEGQHYRVVQEKE